MSVSVLKGMKVLPSPGLHGRGDYRLTLRSSLIGKAVDPGIANGHALAATAEYVHPRRTRALATPATLPGALQTTAAPAR